MGTEVVASRRRIIRRPRLTKLLDESPARIKLLIAPAGYGKTTLAQEWLGDPDRQDVWYRGGPAAADVAALAAGLSVAASGVVPEAGKRMRERLRATGHPEEDVEILAELFAEDLQPWPDHAWLVIDDYQFTMESTASESFIDLLVTKTPLQLLITSRRRPSWATARRILYGEIQEMDRRALTMKRAEAREVLGTGESAERLIERAHGWPAVLGLAAVTSHHKIPTDDLPDELYEYFAEELYGGATRSLREALHRLALVPSLTSTFAHLLLGPRAPIVIEDCSRIGALTFGQEELALHPLLRAFLNKKQAREEPETLRTTADEIARLLIAQQRWDAAFQLVSSHASPDLVVPLIEAARDPLLAEGRTHTLLTWLEFAGDKHLVHASLDFAEAEVLFRQGHYAKAEVLASQAATDSSERSAPRMLIRAGQAAVMDSRDEEGLEYFRKARESATEELDRLEAGVGVCFAALELGLIDEATQAVGTIATVAPRGIDTAARKAAVELAYASRVGGVHAALSIGARIISLLDDASDPLVVTSFLNCYAYVLELGAFYPEALDVANRQIVEANRYRLSFALPHACLTKAASLCGLRDFAKASAEIDNAESSAGPGEIYVAVRAAALRTRIALSRQNYTEAAAHSSKRWERQASPSMMAEYLAYRALTYACLADDVAARDAIAKVRMIPATGVETMTLAACAEAVSSLATATPNAASMVRSAYRLIDETGGVDTLVTVARAYPRFIEALLGQEAETTAVRGLLARSNDFRLARTLGLDIGGHPQGPQSQLTHREVEVGQLVAQGYTNREIAESLFISISTVKVHVRHILEKLNARTRAEIAGRLMTDRSSY